MRSDINRRRFMGSAVATSVFTVVPRHVLGGAGHVAPSDKITLAHIGMGTQGFSELGSLLENPQLQIVAVCDPNRESNDYVEWGKNSVRNTIRNYLGQPTWREGDTGCPGGRDIGKQAVDTYYANHRNQKGKACTAYADFRDLLETEKDVDAVKIMTPDHLHATILIAAMNKGKHVMVHKPLANRLAEGRKVVQTARKTGVATHLLAYGSGAENGLIASILKEGVIGTLREVHNWTNRPVWPQYTEIPKDTPPIPKGFNWDLWLGPERDRPYHPHYTHTVFRGWYDFGGGSMADMGIYSLWPIFAALNLDVATSAQAWATHTCAIVDQVSRRTRNDFSYPTACTLKFTFAARPNCPAFDLHWYDGGMKPRLPDLVEAHNVELPREGIFYVGDEGVIMGGFLGQDPQLFLNDKVEPLWNAVKPPSNSNDASAASRGRYASWIDAVKGRQPSPGSFLSAAAITDTVNLGTVALRAGKKVEFDSQAMRITNSDNANNYLHRKYRKGWEL